MPIRRPLAALCLAALITLAGCSSGGEQADPNEAPGGAEESTDPGAEQQPTPPEPEVDDVPDVVAEVNGEEIARDEFVAAYEGQLQQAFLMQQGEGIDQGALKQQVAEQLVNSRLLVQSAEASGIEASDADVDAELEGLAEQNGLDGIDGVLEAFEAQGVSEEMARKDIASQFKINRFLEEEIDVEEPSDEELKEQYDDLVEQMEAQGEQAGSEEALPSFEEVREMLLEQAVQEQKNAGINEILEGLRGSADVTIHL